MRLIDLIRAREAATSIFTIDYDRLYREGKRAILFDLDNTLGKRHAKELDPRVTELLENLEQMGFRVGILTNRRRIKDDPVIAALSSRYPLLHTARKPRRAGFLQLLSMLDVPPSQAVMVGDLVFTDVIGANRTGIYSIRVKRAHRPQ